MFQQYSIAAVGFLVCGMASSVAAATIFDDHFTGTGPGVPPGWTGNDTDIGVSIDDSAATTVSVTAQNATANITNNTQFNPQNGATWTVEIDGFFGNALMASGYSGDFAWRFGNGQSNMEVLHPNGLESLFYPMPATYNGEAIDVTATVFQTGFQVTATNGFDSGLQP